MRNSRHSVSLGTFGLAFAVVLSPAFMQTNGFSCSGTGETTLSSLEFEVAGVNQIAFDSALRSYVVPLPLAADAATLRAVPTDLGERVSYNFSAASGFIEGGWIGVGGGELTLDLPVGRSRLNVSVKAPGGASDFYSLNISVGCSDCNDGNNCTGDGCNSSVQACVHTPEAEGNQCDIDGLPGLCTAGKCESICSGVDCDDGDPCTTDSCSTGSCTHDPVGGCGPEFVFEQVYVDLAYGGNGRPGWVQAGDIDGDGDFDIVAGGGRALFVYENDGSARGWLRHGNLDSTGAIGANGALLADVDEDGDLDVISAKYYDDIGWWENPCGTQCDLSTVPQWSFHKIGEVGNNGSNGPHYYLHDIARIPSSGNDNRIQFVAPAVSTVCGNVAMKWFEPVLDVRQEWSAHVIESGRSTHSDGRCNYSGLDTGDVNGDGRIDIAFSNGWYEAPVDAQQTWPSSNWHPITSYSEISNTLLRDLNGDGRLDFVTASGHYDGVREVHWYANPVGALGVWPVRVIASLRSPECLQVQDIDGDGDLDVVTCTLFWDQWDQEVHGVYLFANAGLGDATSWIATNVAPNSYPSHLLQLLDLNGDGSLDIISEATGHSVISYYENLD